MRKRIFEIIETAQDGDRVSHIYDLTMIVLILASILPLCFKQTNTTFNVVEQICVLVFCVDYLLRLATADLKLQRGVKSFFLYPATPMALIDLLSLLPSFLMISSAFRLLRTLRLLRSLRVLRAFKTFRYSTQLERVVRVIREQREPLISVLILALGYIFITALIMFTVEADSFDSFFDALYWATTALTTVGYGDIYPISTAGKLISMLSSLVGIAVVALPAGIITSGYMTLLSHEQGGSQDGKEKESDPRI